MNNRISFSCIILFLINTIYCFSQNAAEFYDCKKVDLQNIKCEMSGTYLEEDIEDKNYSNCFFYDISLNGSGENTRILYYAEEDYIKDTNRHSKIEINGQKFIIDGFELMYSTEFYFFTYSKRKYLFVTADSAGGHHLRFMYIFDVTDIEHIHLYLLKDNSFLSKEPLIGIFHDELCFFSADRVHDYNGEYFYAPYVIKNNELQEMTDASGKQYRVYFNVSYPGYAVTVEKKTF